MNNHSDNPNDIPLHGVGLGKGNDDVSMKDDEFCIDDFDEAGIEFPAELESPQRLIEGLCGANRNDSGVGKQGILFPHVAVSEAKANHRAEPVINPLWDIVVRAYSEVRCDRSSDYVVADPAADALYLKRCTELGAVGVPAAELNWMLMNARKAGRLAKLPPAKAFSVPKERLDSYSFAADIAMRTVQERIYFENQRAVSIDQVLCDPDLAREFDRVACGLAPDFGAFEYRWAAISLRKARRSVAEITKSASFEFLGLLEDVRPIALEERPGTYWIRSGESSILTGVAVNMRRQVGALLEHVGYRFDAVEMKERPIAKMSLAVSFSGSYNAGEYVRASLLQGSGSRLNFWYGDFLRGAAA